MSATPPGWPPAPAGVHHYSCACNELHDARITRDEYGDLSRKGSSRRALSVKSRQAKRAEPCSHASHDSNGVALLTWQAAGEWSVRACVQTMCHSEPGSYQACGAEGPSACRILGGAANVEAANLLYLTYMPLRPMGLALGLNTIETASMGVSCIDPRSLGRVARLARPYVCGAFSSPKTVILRRAPDRLSTISTTGSCTGQTTMLCEGSPRNLVHPLRWIASLRVS